MAQLSSSPDRLSAAAFEQVLSTALGRTELPDELSTLRPLEKAMFFHTLQDLSDEEYPTDLLETLRTFDDCYYFYSTKHGRK